MHNKVSVEQFRDSFKSMGREDGWTYEGLGALYEWLEECFAEGDEYELDVIALCCDFCEYESLDKYNEDYGSEYEEIEQLENRTIVIPVGDEGFIAQNI